MATDTFAGPVDFLVFALPADAPVGAGLQALLAAVDAAVIEVLDLAVVGRGEDAAPIRLSLSDLAGAADADLTAFDGVASGILDADDLSRIAEELEPGDVAIALVYEDRSLAATAAAWTAVGGTELFSGGVAIEDLAHALEGTDQA